MSISDYTVTHKQSLINCQYNLKLIFKTIIFLLKQQLEFTIFNYYKHFSLVMQDIPTGKTSTVFWCLLNALVHKTHPLSSPKNLVKILVPIYKTQEDSVKHAR